MKIGKLAEMTEEELRRERSTIEERIFRLRFQLGTGNIENPSKLRETRKDLARVRTLLREIELKLDVSHESTGPDAQKEGGTTDSEAK
jgi:large subunit ribosomal protein L29